MTYIIPQSNITIKEIEIRTSKNGDPYYLITDTKDEVYGDWRSGERMLGEFPLLKGDSYKIEYTVSRDGKYKNVKSAWKV